MRRPEREPGYGEEQEDGLRAGEDLLNVEIADDRFSVDQSLGAAFDTAKEVLEAMGEITRADARTGVIGVQIRGRFQRIMVSVILRGASERKTTVHLYVFCSGAWRTSPTRVATLVRAALEAPEAGIAVRLSNAASRSRKAERGRGR